MTYNYFSRLLLFFIIFVSHQSKGQLKVNIPVEYYRNILRDGSLPADFTGSPYFDNEFKKGLVLVKDDKPYTAMLRHNAFTDAIEIEQEGKYKTLLKRNYISVIINNRKFKITPYLDINNERKLGYFIELTQGQLKLLKREQKEFKAAEQATSTYKKNKPARLIKNIEYYLQIGKDQAVPIKLKRKSLLNVLRRHPRAKVLLNEKDVKLSNENDAIKFIEELNSELQEKN